MDLLIAANTVTQAQADTAPASGTPGWATDGNPATGLLATDAPAWHYNMMMAELIAIIKAAGFTPSNADWSQVLKAMQTIFAPAQYGVAPFSASLAQLIGGYPLGAIAFDAAGNYWQSTKANNLTVPGAEGADWVNFFAGVMTQQQADLRYLPLAGGNVTGNMDWGDKATAGTTTHRFWAAGTPAEGDATPDATLIMSGGTPGTPNKGTMQLSTGLFDLSKSGQVLVPSIITFDGKDALNAETADARYIQSVSDTTNALKRIISLLENADGRAVFGDGTNTSILANLADLPIADPKTKLQIFTALTPQQATGPIRISFPTAFKAGTVPKVVGIVGNMEGGGHGAARTYCIANTTAATNSPAIDNTGFYLDQTYLDTTVNPALGWSEWPGSLDILVAGEMP